MLQSALATMLTLSLFVMLSARVSIARLRPCCPAAVLRLQILLGCGLLLTGVGMFIGHYSAAFVAAAHPRAPSLGVLFIGAQLVDLGFFSFVLTGVEAMRITPGFTVMNPMDLYHMPYTHSLVGNALWAAGFALVLRMLCRNWVAAALGGAVVLSHWFIDFAVHGPDLTLWGSPPKFGLGLWNYPLIEMPLEIALTFGAMWLYLRATQAARKSYAVPVLATALIALQAINWFSPPPQTLEPAQPITALIAYMIAAALALWVARTRTANQV